MLRQKEAIELLRKLPDCYLWDKDFIKWEKEDFEVLLKGKTKKRKNKTNYIIRENKCKLVVKNTGEIYKNAFIAAKENNIHFSTISRILNGILIRRIGEYKYVNK
jgi:hypothetical protein